MSASPPAIAFYTVADERYFLGAVGLVNSLRLVGHREPIFLLDCGLAPAQRELLVSETTLVPPGAEAPPWLLKTVAPLRQPAERMILLDADIVVTRSLEPLTESAGDARLVGFRNPIDRFVPEWGELLGLGPAKRRPYMSSAAICFGRALGAEILRLMDSHQDAVDFELTHWRRNQPGYAFTYADQDVLNAILATQIDPVRVLALEHRLAATPPFEGLKLADERSLRCSYGDRVEPFLVHHLVSKPWLERTHHGVYSQLLRRLLIGDDVAVKVPEAQIPRRFRAGLRAYAERKRINARERLRYHLGEPLRARMRGRA